MRRCLLAVVLLAVVPAPASAEPGHKVLKYYVREVTPVIQSYRSVAGRADEVLSTQPSEDLEPLVEGLSDVAAQFDRLAKRWQGIKAPPGLGLKHRGMGGAFHLQARAFADWADGWRQFGDTNDVAVLTAAND